MDKIRVVLLAIIFPMVVMAHSSSLLYEENKGQWDKQVLFKLGLKNIDLYFEKNSITFQMYDFHELLSNDHPKSRARIIAERSTAYYHSYKVEFMNANNNVDHKGLHAAETYHNYYIGNDPQKWASGVKLFEEINYTNLYNGIDLKMYSNDMQPKYDFIVKHGADISKIAMKYTGADRLQLREDNLIITTSLGLITEQKPYAYQYINGKKVEVLCKYVLKNSIVTFDLPNGYDKNYELTIDPVLIGSTYSGSTADNWGFTATYDNSSNMYSGGIVTNTRSGPGSAAGTFPITVGAFQTTFGGGGTGGSYPWPWDIAIVKYNTTGSAQLYSTYLGGSENEYPHSMVVNNSDELYVFGKTYSTNFPVSSTAYDKTLSGKADIIVTKFNSAGTALLGSTYIGGTDDDGVNFDADELIFGNLKFNYGDDARGEIIVDKTGDCYVASCTKSLNFPVTAGAYKTTYAGGGQDGCVFKLNSGLTALTWSTFLGGTADDAVFGLTLDNANNVYVAGGTMSSDFPVTSGVLNTTYKGSIDGFVSIVKNNGTALMASTYIGTSSYDQCYFVQSDKKDNVYVYGQTKGVYTVTAGVYSSTKGGLFIHKINSALTMTAFSTIIGDAINTSPNISPSAFLVDNCENVYIAGWGGKCSTGIGGGQGNTTGLPVTSDAYQSSTDGCDFYLMSLSKNAATLIYATFFGAGGNRNEHVDGGTSRFDKRGVVYQSVCASCGGTSTFPTTATAWSKTNKSGNCNNAVFKIDFQTPNVVAIASTTGVVGCAPLTYTFINGSANASSYEWDFGDGSPIDYSTAPSHQFVNGGTYTVKIIAKNPLSCNGVDSATVQVTVTPGPVVDLGVDYDMTCNALKDITLDAKNAGSTYLWNTGATTQSIQPPDSGKYWVTATSTTTGCSSVDTINLVGPPMPEGARPYIIPNIFTPNGDSKNDTFVISAKGQVSEFNIKIYNRWGLLVFESNDINNSWSGKIGSSDASDGTYYYLLNFNSSCIKSPYSDRGFITLLR
ncbi:MAG: gliding motility-associated C-terminal domain-containing protein [Bacteroidetes bacterium]|nr:gliding motility-associated C-terminal domain-containing protein [Bacteroidota bacterium]